MPQVPYTPYPTQAPSTGGTPSISVNAPGAAFGENIGRAVEGLGKVVEGAGNELFARAEAMQQLTNETDAKNADVEFIGKAGELHAQYNTLQGMDRVRAFPKYSKDLNELYTATRGTLTNPSAQKMFDSTAVGTIKQSIFNGAGAAASAQKEASLTSIVAEEELLKKQTYNDPNNELGFRDAVQRLNDSAPTRAALSPGGLSSERLALIRATGISELARNRIEGMASKNPEKASQLFDQYKKEGLLLNNDAERTESKLNAYISSVGVDQIAQEVSAKYLTKEGEYQGSSKDMQAEARTLAESRYPDNPRAGTLAERAVDSVMYRNRIAQTIDKQNRNQVVDDYVMKGVTNIDLIPPDVRKAMKPDEQIAFNKKAQNWAHVQQNQTDQAMSKKYIGMYSNPAQHEEFMNTDFLSVSGMSVPLAKQLHGLQKQANADGDVRVKRAVEWLRGSKAAQLTELGLDKPDKSDKYNTFLGVIHDGVQSWQDEHKKPITQKEFMNDLWPLISRNAADPSLIRKMLNPLVGPAVTPEFDRDIDEQMRGAASKDLGIDNPSNDQIHRTYMRELFKVYFENEKAKKAGPPAASPAK